MSKSDMPSKAEERAYLADPNVPQILKRFVMDGGAFARADTNRKIASSARAEGDAMAAALYMAESAGELVDLEEAKAKIFQLECQLAAYQVELEEKNHAIERLTAAPALAVHSED